MYTSSGGGPDGAGYHMQVKKPKKNKHEWIENKHEWIKNKQT